MPTPEFTEQEIDGKLAEIGLRRGIVSVETTCDKLQCSRSHYYAALAGPPGTGRELRHVSLSEKVSGTYSIDIAQLLLRRERAPLPVRPRGRKRQSAT
jgi:hypothetical protein